MSLQPEPLPKKYKNLKYEIEEGYIKIPKFQRDFVWSIDKTAKLLDSILKGYPIGTFILWETKERLNDIKDIGNIKLPAAKDGEKIQYVLDGQQRITSLYAAYIGAKIQKKGEKKITDYSNIYVKLDTDISNNDSEIVVSEKPDNNFITLKNLLNFKYSELRKLYSDEYIDKIQEYKETFTSYDFSTIVLRKDDIDTAIEVFTRINTSGQTLTLFEIMSAKTYDENKNFDMTKKYRDLLKVLAKKGYDTISGMIILNSISLIISKNKDCTRRTILNLDKQEIIDVWDDVISSLIESINYFISVYRIPASAILPYDSLLIPFTYFYYKQKEGPKRIQIKYLEEFFWRMSLSYRYSSSTETKLSQDIKRIDKILNNERPEYDDIKLFIEPNDLINTNFSTGNSFCKAILCLLAYNEPKSFDDNGKIAMDNNYLKSAHSKNYHHFFPKKYLRNINKRALENSIVNITIVSEKLNKKDIRDQAPSVYIKEFLDNNPELESSIKSHLISDLNKFGIWNDEYDIFLRERAKLISDELKKRIELRHEEDKKEEELKELILNGENENLEFKAALRYDKKTERKNDNIEYQICKTISAFLNTNGGKLLIGVDDDGNILGLENDYNTLEKKPNRDGFELHLKQIIAKYLEKNYEKYIKIKFPEIENKTICLIEVSQSGKPVFITNKQKEQQFYVRYGNSNLNKNREDQYEYIKEHFKI